MQALNYKCVWFLIKVNC